MEFTKRGRLRQVRLPKAPDAATTITEIGLWLRRLRSLQQGLPLGVRRTQSLAFDRGKLAVGARTLRESRAR